MTLAYDIDQAEKRGAEEEREAIVAWLREQGRIMFPGPSQGARYNIAEDIQRGDHLTVSAPTEPSEPCDGSSTCIARTHIHGCYADRRNCDAPEEHNVAAPLPSTPRRMQALTYGGSRVSSFHGREHDKAESCDYKPRCVPVADDAPKQQEVDE